jgi:hypothetical protein
VAGAVFTELSLFLILQDAEGFAEENRGQLFVDDNRMLSAILMFKLTF